MDGATPETRRDEWPVVELRQYTLVPHGRDVLIELFEREFVESQEQVGMRLIGQFRSSDQPDRFVWLRAFRDMETRREALSAFYGGPVWKAHRERANATMIDSSNVLLLRPAGASPGVAAEGHWRPPVGSDAVPPSRFVATICSLPAPVDAKFVGFFEDRVKPALSALGGEPLTWFQTEPAENTFPALPVRTGENVFVWLTRFDTDAHLREHRAQLSRSSTWSAQVEAELRSRFGATCTTLDLEPTPRSALR